MEQNGRLLQFDEKESRAYYIGNLDSPWWDLENVIISPHASSDSPRTYEGRREIFKENIRRFLANKPFIYVCDKIAGF